VGNKTTRLLLTMNTQRLAAKQKRIKDWDKAKSDFNSHPRLAHEIEDALKKYRNLLAKCWEEGHVTENEASEIEDLEARIDQLHEESRLLSRPSQFP